MANTIKYKTTRQRTQGKYKQFAQLNIFGRGNVVHINQAIICGLHSVCTKKSNGPDKSAICMGPCVPLNKLSRHL
jgi:hypothetical protein